MTEDFIDHTDVLDDTPDMSIITIDKTKRVRLAVTREEIQQLKDELLPLKINGIADKAGYKVADAKRKMVRKKRIAINNYVESIKKAVNAWKSDLMEDGEFVNNSLLEIENHLGDQQDVVDAEKTKIKEEKEKEEAEKLAARVAKLNEYSYPFDPAILKKLTDPEFESTVAMAKMKFESDKAYRESLEQKQQQTEEQLNSLKQLIKPIITDAPLVMQSLTEEQPESMPEETIERSGAPVVESQESEPAPMPSDKEKFEKILSQLDAIEVPNEMERESSVDIMFAVKCFLRDMKNAVESHIKTL